MTDIAKCDLHECPRKGQCYRYTAPSSISHQSYLANPKEDCLDKNFEMQMTLKKLDAAYKK